MGDSLEEYTLTDDDLSVDGLELDVPLHFNKLLYDASDSLLACSQDYVDGGLQFKGISESAKTDDLWNEAVIKEAIGTLGISDMHSLVDESDIGGDMPSVSTFIDEFAMDLNDHIANFSSYAYYIEYVVAMVEQTLREGLTEKEYNSVIAELRDNSSINSLAALASNPAVKTFGDRILSASASRTGIAFGKAMKPAGLYILSNLLHGNTSVLSANSQLQLFKDGLSRFLGTSADSATKVSFGARLKGSAVGAGVFFLILEGIDLATGEFSWENTAINASRAAVGCLAGTAGSAVTSALAGGAAGSWAGPIGIGVGIVISLVGNLLIDTIVHRIRYTDNDIPRNYEETTYESVREKLLNDGLVSGTPRIYSNESAYDTVSNLYSRGADQSVIDYCVSCASGEPTGSLDAATYTRYNTVVQAFRQCAMDGAVEPDISGFDPYPSTREDYLFEMEQYIWDCNDEDRAFMNSLFDLFENRDSDPWVQELYDNFVNGTILDDYKNVNLYIWD
jgi:hypothetical protein